jgi:hypothetical protein
LWLELIRQIEVDQAIVLGEGFLIGSREAAVTG